MTSLRLVLRPKPGISSEQSRDARAHAWAFVFECLNRREEKEGSPAAAPSDAKEIRNDRATQKYTG
jgi:hypothetical protein